MDLTCDNCYARGDFMLAGRIAASVNDGVKEGHVAVSGKWNSRLALAMKLQGNHQYNLIKKQLLAVNMVHLQIPGFLSIGPQVSVTAEVDLSFNAEADILVGATLDMEPSLAQVDFINNQNSWIDGFHPVLTPIAKFRGDQTLSAKLALGLPLALEFGLDVLNGKWKRNVGLVERPSFAVTAEKSDISGCSNGIQIGLSIDNEIYIESNIRKQHTHKLRIDNLWNHPLACIEGPTMPLRANSEIGAGAAGNDTNNDVSGSIPYDIQNP